MTLLNQLTQTKTHLTQSSTIAKHRDFTRIRIQIHIPPDYQQEPVISRLISNHGLLINITGAKLEPATQEGKFDLELRGTPQQIHTVLMYLRSLNIKLIGKPNAEGDSWYY